jgi:hypothetical protein
MNHRRRAFTLLELLFAAAVLATSLLAAYTFLWQGFENGVDLLRRDMADSIARTVVERYGQVPFGGLVQTFRGDDARDVLEDDDDVLVAGLPRSPEVLRRMGFQVLVGFTRTYGEIPTGVLDAEVSWPLPGGKRRSLSYRRTIVSDGSPAEMTATSSPRSGNPAPSDWGSARTWHPSPKPVPRTPAPGEPILRRRAFRQRLDTTEASRELALGAGITWADAARAVAAAYRPGPGGERGPPALGFEGDAALAARMLGPSGDLSRRVGDPAKVREARDRRREARFLARTGARLDPWLADDIPDGDYAYRLEAQDLRDEDGVGRVVGVYVLEDEADSYHLVRDVEFAPDVTEGDVEGDPVYRVTSFRDTSGRPVTLRRTETRLYFLRPGRRGRAWIRTLDAPDGTYERQAWTARQVAKLQAELGLEPVDPPATRADDGELVKVANPDVRWAGASGCSSGSCQVPPPRVEQRALLAPPPAAPTPRRRDSGSRGPARLRSYAAAPPPLAAGATLAGGTVGGDREPASDVDAEVRAVESLAFTDPEAAIRRLDDVLLHEPDHGPARALRGRLFALRGYTDQATEDLRAAQRDPRVAEEVLPDLAGVLIRSDELDEAERLLDQFRAVRPDDPNGQTLALALRDRREFLAQAAPPAGGGAAAPPAPDIGGGAVGIPSGWSGMSWSVPGNEGSVMFRPPTK